jgi:hypothetical protein
MAYAREFRLSPLVEALDKAKDYGITVVGMKRDWKRVRGPVPDRGRRAAGQGRAEVPLFHTTALCEGPDLENGEPLLGGRLRDQASKSGEGEQE